MVELVKNRLLLIKESPSQPLCLTDASDVELVHLIHNLRQRWGRLRNIGPYTIQHSVCLHMVSGHYPENREVAKSEDAVLRAVPNFDSIVMEVA